MQPQSEPSAAIEKQVELLRKHALAYPETHEDFPWGHSAFKVNGKAFVFLSADAEGLSLSVKLPESGALALALPFAEPTGYGLGKSGWVSARFAKAEEVPSQLLQQWFDESYRAVAPKRLSKTLDGGPGAAPSAGAPAKKTKRARPAAKKTKSARPAAQKTKRAPTASAKARPTKTRPAKAAKATKRQRPSTSPAKATRRKSATSSKRSAK